MTNDYLPVCESSAPARALTWMIANWILILAALMPAGPAWAALSDKPRLAVMPFMVRGDLNTEDAGEMIAEMMSNALASTGRYSVMERMLLKQILEEQELQNTPLAGEKVSEMGRLLGVNTIVTGSVMKWDTTITIVAKMVDASSGEILASEQAEAVGSGQVQGRVQQLAYALAGMGDSGQTQQPAASHSSPHKGTASATAAPYSPNIIAAIHSSSHLTSQKDQGESFTYGPSNVIDGDAKTAWVEGADGNGEGEWIQLDFSKLVHINAISINGEYKGQKE